MRDFPLDHVDIDDCRSLWRAVLAENYRTARGDGSFPRTELDRKQAREWMGSRSFERVCELAGMDPEAVMDQFKRDISMGFVRVTSRNDRGYKGAVAVTVMGQRFPSIAEAERVTGISTMRICRARDAGKLEELRPLDHDPSRDGRGRFVPVHH